MPNWVINSNGDAPETFRDSYTKVACAANELLAALVEVRLGPMHGRNYQTLTGNQPREDDIDDLARHWRAIEAAHNWAVEGMVRHLAQRPLKGDSDD